MRLWDVKTHQPLGEPLRGHHNEVYRVAFSPDGQMLASASADHTVRLWDAKTHQPRGAPLRYESWAWDVAFSPDGQMLASASADGTLRLWDTKTHQPLGEPLQGHDKQVYAVAFSPNGQTLASSGADNTVRLWELNVTSWPSHACRLVNRNLSRREWDRFVGATAPYVRTCPAFPSGLGAPSDAPPARYPRISLGAGPVD